MGSLPETYSYTGDQLAAQVEQKFGDSGGVQITRAMQLGWINNGIRAITQQNPFKEATAQTNLLAGVSAYDLSAIFPTNRILSIVAVTISGISVDLIPFPEFQGLIADNVSPGQAPSTGKPTVGAIFGGILTLWPQPQLTVASGITVYLHTYPADLAVITDKITVPDRFYNALFDYVFAQALELSNNFPASQVKLQHFQTGVQREFERENSSPTDFYPTITPDPYDNDNVYWPGNFS